MNNSGKRVGVGYVEVRLGQVRIRGFGLNLWVFLGRIGMTDHLATAKTTRHVSG